MQDELLKDEFKKMIEEDEEHFQTQTQEGTKDPEKTKSQVPTTAIQR